MEEDQNDLFFNEEAQIEEPPALSAPGNDENQPNDAEQNEIQEIPLAVAKKKRSMKPQPKLDVRRLLGPRGLPCLDKEFENVKFHGHGHEEEDLDLLMSRLEHWAHRLYPRMTFDDCLEKIEKLGHKKEIQTCMKKLRMGMLLLNAAEETTVITEDGPDAENQDNDNIDNEILNIPMGDEF